MLAKKFCGKEVCVNYAYRIAPQEIRFYVDSNFRLGSTFVTVHLYRKYSPSFNHKFTYKLELNLNNKDLSNSIINQIRIPIICNILEKVGYIEDRLEVVIC